MTEHSSSTNPAPTWKEILQAVALRSKADYDGRVRPTVDAGRSTVAELLVRLSQKIQPTR